jgi:hypothetical protein
VPIFILVPFRASAVVRRCQSPHHRSSMFRKKLVCARGQYQCASQGLRPKLDAPDMGGDWVFFKIERDRRFAAPIGLAPQ